MSLNVHKTVYKKKEKKHIWHATASAAQQPASVNPVGGGA